MSQNPYYFEAQKDRRGNVTGYTVRVAEDQAEITTFRIGKSDDWRVAHHLAQQMTTDLNEGIE